MVLKVMCIFGTRPEAIKMAPVVKELEKNKDIESIVCVTAQHREMLDQVLEVFRLEPQYDLDIMKKKQSLTQITTRSLEGLEEVIKEVKPDIILVHGDTTTTFAGAMAAFYNKVMIGHVEAGLRTYDKYQPFPEEINRKLTGVLADMHFAPTQTAKKHLLTEGVNEKDIYVTGNTVIDALKTTIKDNYHFKVEELNKLDYSKKIITITAHRRENLGEPLLNICTAVKKIVENNNDVEVVYAVHKNPAVRETVYNILSGHDRIHLLEPLEMEDMHNLLNRSYLVLTDSGGLQEEVPSMGKPVLVLRNVTERPEGVEAGTLKLVGTDEKVVFETANMLLNDKVEYEKMANAINPYGDGNSSERIVANILYRFQKTDRKPGDFIVTN